MFHIRKVKTVMFLRDKLFHMKLKVDMNARAGTETGRKKKGAQTATKRGIMLVRYSEETSHTMLSKGERARHHYVTKWVNWLVGRQWCPIFAPFRAF